MISVHPGDCTRCSNIKGQYQSYRARAEDLKARVRKDPIIERSLSSPSSWLNFFPVLIKVWADQEKHEMEVAGLGRSST